MKWEIGGSKLEASGRKYDVGKSKKVKVGGGRRSAAGDRKYQVGGKKLEIRNRRSEAGNCLTSDF
jgi:hypothetical protein